MLSSYKIFNDLLLCVASIAELRWANAEMNNLRVGQKVLFDFLPVQLINSHRAWFHAWVGNNVTCKR
jgi:hypothetical protein